MRQIFIILFTLLSVVARAQFFSFDYPQRQPQQHQMQEKFTAPRFKGGTPGLEAFQRKNFRNPSERKDIKGTIIVAVIVNVKGKVADAQVVRHLSDELDSEALRVAKKLKFKPATIGKKKTKARVDIVFPIRHGVLSFVDLNTIDV